MTETRKLLVARGFGLPDKLFADVAPKVRAGWRRQCGVEAPSHLRRRSPESALMLIAAFLS